MGDCAKGMLVAFQRALLGGIREEYLNCTSIWANRPDVGIANYVRQSIAVREGMPIKATNNPAARHPAMCATSPMRQLGAGPME